MGWNTTTVAGVEISTDHWIGGHRVASNERFADLSPVDGSHLADVSAAGRPEVDAAVAAARQAFPAWAAFGPEGRLPILKRFAEGIRARASELAAVETISVHRQRGAGHADRIAGCRRHNLGQLLLRP